MLLLRAFFRLIRLPNLVFIILTQWLFYYCVFYPVYPQQALQHAHNLYWLIAASVLIAAAGYIINDYFDINIDEINKPGKLVIDKIISRRWAMVLHQLFSAAGIACTYKAVGIWHGGWMIILANAAVVGLLWFYSTHFKKQLIIGNVVIALLTAWTIIVVYLSVYIIAAFPEDILHSKLFRITFLYAGFAFISTLIREAVKDLEEMAGDMQYNCKTMPVIWGINATKVYTGVWFVVLLLLLVILQLYVLQFEWWWAVVYCVALLIIPVAFLLQQLRQAQHSGHFHRLSNYIKLVMLAGILSMVFFYFYS